MPEQDTTFRSVYQGEKDFKKEYAKLGRKITDIAAHKVKGVNANDPEYWGLREVLTDDMVKVANKMKLRKFYTFEELYAMNPEYEASDFQQLLFDMSYIGIMEYDYGDNYTHDAPIKDALRVRRYRLPYFVPGSAELFNSSRDRIAKNPAVTTFFERMTFQPLAGITQMVPPGGDGIGMHVIPVEKAIEFENESVDLEHISYWLKKYEGHISCGLCSCRYSTAVMGIGCGDDPDNWCIQVGDMADYAVETKRAHYITHEEAIEILKKAEENGFVHQITNIDGSEKIFDICNCDVKICHALRTSQLFNTPNLSRSAYTSKVTKDKCVACGRCVEVCPVGAVKLGQKLCKKDGREAANPKSVLPDKIKWGKYAWDENYRDTARLSNSWPNGTAPCKAACPAHIAIQGYLKKAHDGEYREALELIKRENPFPAVCGRICNKPCEDACTRGTVDEAISIDAVKKFIADWEIKEENRYIPEKAVPSTYGKFDEKIAIIGAGPAGLSCAYYLALLGYSPTVFEKNAKAGGMLTYGIPSYKLEKDVIDAEIDVIRQLGVEIRTNCEVGKDVTLKELRDQGYKAFYLAIGCQGGRRPGVPNDDAPETAIAVEYLHDALEKGHAPFTGKVAVIGGGNVAIDCAITAAKRKASEVTMFSLESREEMPAKESEIAEALEEKVKIANSWGPKEVLLDDSGHVKGLVMKRCTQVFEPETHRFSPQYDESDTITVEADFIIFAIGQSVVWGDLLKDTSVTFHHGNYPVADPLTYQTEDPDIFVGGDLYTGPKFVIDAIAQGHHAADSLHRRVRPGAEMVIGRERHVYKPFDTADISLPTSYDTAGRQEEAASSGATDPFRDGRLSLTEEQVKIETGRCLSCGAAEVDQNKCIGCGLCTTRCGFDAIHLYRDKPEMTKMVRGEDKFGPLIAYQVKRAFKILANSGSKEARLMRKKRRAYNAANKDYSKTHPFTGNAYKPEIE